MSILEVIACIMEVEQLRKKAATESAAKDQETKTATKADDAKSSAESSEKRFVMIKKIADGIYEIAGVSEDDLNEFIGMMDFIAHPGRPEYIDFMDFLREGAQADQSKNDTDKSKS